MKLPTVLAHPRTADDDTLVKEIHVTSFFHPDLTLDRDHRTFDQGCRV